MNKEQIYTIETYKLQSITNKNTKQNDWITNVTLFLFYLIASHTFIKVIIN